MSAAEIRFVRSVDRPVGRAPGGDPRFPRASEVVADKVAGEPLVVLLGVPFGAGSLSGARCEAAPAAVRGSLGRFSSYSSDFGVELPLASVLDAGDVEVHGDVADTQARIAAAVDDLCAQHGRPVALVGGDNSITVGGFAGSGADGLITFDAHHDVRDGTTNGSPVRQILDGGLPGDRVVQIGIHGFANSREYAQRASDAGIVWVAPDAVRGTGIASIVDQSVARLADNGATRIWVDVDLDCLDRAFAPGTAAAMPGGLWPADLVRAAFLLGASPYVCGLDTTELDPTTDVGDATVRTTVAVLLAFVAGVASR